MLSLDDQVTKLHLVGPAQARALNYLGLKTIRELLYHFPRDWQDRSEIKTISQIRPNELINLKARIKKLGERRTKWRRLHLTEALLEDDTGNVVAVWFNQPFLRRQLQEGREYYFTGKGTIYETLQLQNPSFELVKPDTIHTAGIISVYELTEGLTLKQFRYWLKQALAALPQITDHLPATIKSTLTLPDLKDALQNLHFPKTHEALAAARKRLAFDELFIFQLALLSFKSKLKNLPAPAIPLDLPLVKDFIAALPFKLTDSQKLAIWEILQDLQKSHPMNRLLQGEVGSGKTVVAGLAMQAVAGTGYQAVLLSPTEILAWQHYQTLKDLFKNTDLTIALLTRSHKISAVIARSREGDEAISKNKELATPPTEAGARNDDLLNNIAAGRTKLIVGTHALLQEKVSFQKIGLLVVDEQHRFGVKQRALLARRSTQIETPITADNELLYKELTYKMRGAIFNVYNTLGPGQKEIVYHNALLEEFKQIGIPFDTQTVIFVDYAGKKIGSYKPDIIIDNKIILEIKALPFIGKLEEKQIWHYLKGSDFKLALLVNFGSSELQIKRMVYDSARHRRESALHPSESANKWLPHLLSMSATPIPRTLALTFYGDLDISTLKQLPSGRKKVITRLVQPDKRAVAYEFIKKQILAGRQVYIITPLIEESDKLGVKAASLEVERLKKEIFPEFQIALLHGRMPGEEKQKIMQDFKSGKTHILVSTTVVEVGVDVPNAAVMVIENAERFGLSQLHQLRGRVGRAEHQSYCLLFAEAASEYTRKRLEAVVNSNDGFELAEKDLELRGPGEVMGSRQSGYIPLKIAKLSDRKLIKLAKQEAEKLLGEDPNLEKLPLLKQKAEEIAKDAHLE